MIERRAPAECLEEIVSCIAVDASASVGLVERGGRAIEGKKRDGEWAV